MTLFHTLGTSSQTNPPSSGDSPKALARREPPPVLTTGDMHLDQKAQEAGAQEVEISLSRDIKRASVESRDMLVEARIVATATGRPPIAD